MEEFLALVLDKDCHDGPCVGLCWECLHGALVSRITVDLEIDVLCGARMDCNHVAFRRHHASKKVGEEGGVTLHHLLLNETYVSAITATALKKTMYANKMSIHHHENPGS